MKLPVLFREQDRAEKLIVESFRLLGQLCEKLADLVEAQRLERAGHGEQGQFLERTDTQAPNKPR
jgi:hypothetical protein